MKKRKKKLPRFLPLERDFGRKGFRVVAGLDEAGRGPWAGPLVCAAVTLKPRIRLPGLTDAKLLTPSTRAFLAKKIQASCDFGIGVVGPEVIDTRGLIKACELGFKRAIANLRKNPDFLLIDGNDHFLFDQAFCSIIRGDRRIRSIAAASVIAKVTRDKLILRLAKRYPNYAFEKHKGYGTRLHRELLGQYGPCEIHRKTYKPIKRVIEVAAKKPYFSRETL